MPSTRWTKTSPVALRDQRLRVLSGVRHTDRHAGVSDGDTHEWTVIIKRYDGSHKYFWLARSIKRARHADLSPPRSLKLHMLFLPLVLHLSLLPVFSFHIKSCPPPRSASSGCSMNDLHNMLLKRCGVFHKNEKILD